MPWTEDPRAGLARALREAAPTPCEKFSCSQREACKVAELACDAFELYVETGQAISPCCQVATRKRRGQQKVIGMNETPEPSAEVFGRLFRPVKRAAPAVPSDLAE